MRIFELEKPKIPALLRLDLVRWAEKQDATQNKRSVFFNYRSRMMSCAKTLKQRLLQTGCVTPARRVDRRIKTFHAAQPSVATNVVCTSHVHREYSNVCWDRTCSSVQTVFLGQPIDSNKMTCWRDRFQMLFCWENLWKDTEKSMTSSKVGLYYFEPKKST